MSFKEKILNAAEDLVTLEVATLTNKSSDALSLSPDLTPAQQTQLDASNKAVDDAKKELLKEIKSNESDRKKKRQAIRSAKDVLKEAEKQLGEVQKALGIYDPKDIFSKIKANLSEAELVAYSRFELEGDSINFITDKEDLKELADSHKDMVAASQEARKAIFESARKMIGNITG